MGLHRILIRVYLAEKSKCGRCDRQSVILPTMRVLRRFPGAWVLLVSSLPACGGRALIDSDPVGVDPSRPTSEGSSGSGPGSAGAASVKPGVPTPSVGGNSGESNLTDAACSRYCQLQQACAGFDVPD